MGPQPGGIALRGLGTPVTRMTHALAEALVICDWPYNVRELLAVAREAAISFNSQDLLDVAAFKSRLHVGQSGDPGRPDGRLRTPTNPGRPVEFEVLRRLLVENGGNVAVVARSVGRSRKQIYRWLLKHGLSAEQFRAPSGSSRLS